MNAQQTNHKFSWLFRV